MFKYKLSVLLNEQTLKERRVSVQEKHDYERNIKVLLTWSVHIVKYVFPPADFHHYGSDQELWWQHQPGWLLRLNPARLAGCSHI